MNLKEIFEMKIKEMCFYSDNVSGYCWIYFYNLSGDLSKYDDYYIGVHNHKIIEVGDDFVTIQNEESEKINIVPFTAISVVEFDKERFWR